MRKSLGVLFCIGLCLTVAFFFTQLGQSEAEFLAHGDDGIVDDTYCLASGCHVLGSFGAGDGSLHGSHSDCAACHDGAPAAGNVFADSCIVCHPAEPEPGLCPLADVHGTSCIGCHTECAQVTTTTTTADVTTTTTTAQVTTTTTSVPGTGEIEVSPERIFRSRWVVIPALLAIRGTGAEFDRRTSKPSYSPDNALIPLPPLQLGAELIVQTVLVKPEWWALAGNQTVTVTVDGSSADFDIELLPFILDK